MAFGTATAGDPKVRCEVESLKDLVNFECDISGGQHGSDMQFWPTFVYLFL
jgi:hypothetical protein